MTVVKLTVICVLGFEAFTAVIMKNAVFWDVTPCGFCKIFDDLEERSTSMTIVMQALRSSETSVLNKSLTALHPRRRQSSS
jgi:hypothetical protein